jgi:hypothetical protein
METKILSIGLLSENRPDSIFDYKNGQGSFLYNHNIKEVMVIKDENGNISVTDDDSKKTGTMFQYDSVRCEYPRTADNIFLTLLTAKYSENKQTKLINEYQSAELGLMDSSYKDNYEAFLKDRISIRDMVDADCKTLNIPDSL